MIELLKAWRFRRRQAKMNAWLADPSTGMGKALQARAFDMAMRMVSNWLDRKHILHCAACPATESLRKIRDKYFCLAHFTEAEEVLAKHEKDLQAQTVAA